MSLDSTSLSEDRNQADNEQSPLGFTQFDLNQNVLKGVEDAGYQIPSPIQKEAIPHVLTGGDLVAQAQTGSGKTAAFAVPALHMLQFNKSVEVLVLVPTRELSLQVVQEFERLAKHLRIGVVSVVGGESGYRQIEMVNRGAQVIVATPGRLLDHLSSNKFKNFKPQMVVLDEADEMLDMGFIDDIRQILAYTPTSRQTLLFSATIPAPIARLANEELKTPKHIKLVSKEDNHQDIEQVLYMVRSKERENALIRLIESESPEKAVVFCRTKRDTIELCENLNKRGLAAQALHGDLTQNERNRAMLEIKRGNTRILVATDVASRGLDIQDLSYVINFHLPESKDRYTHRIGRTGRAGQKGKAISFVTPSELEGFSYLKNYKQSNFTLACLPSRSDVQGKLNRSFVDELRGITITEEAKVTCDQLIPEEESREFLLRLYTYAKRNQKVTGAEELGFSLEDTEKLFNSMSGRRRPSNGRRGGRPPFGRGRSDNRSGGSGRSSFTRRGDRDDSAGQGQSGGRPPRPRKPSKSRSSYQAASH